jgi:hypothetical protein
MDMDGLGEEPGQSKDKIEEEYYFEVSHASPFYLSSLPAGSTVTSDPSVSWMALRTCPCSDYAIFSRKLMTSIVRLWG